MLEMVDGGLRGMRVEEVGHIWGGKVRGIDGRQVREVRGGGIRDG